MHNIKIGRKCIGGLLTQNILTPREKEVFELLIANYSTREIAKRMGIGRNTIAKYRKGDPKELSMYGIHQSKLDPFHDFIIDCLKEGWSKSKTVKAIYEKGYSGSKSNAFDYLCKIEQKENKCFEPQPYIRTMTECLKYKTGSKGKEKDYITREGVFRYMWMNTELSDNHKEYIYEKYPNIWELQCCIREFRNIFKNHNVPMLYLFVEKYSKSLLKPSLYIFIKIAQESLDLSAFRILFKLIS